MAVDDHGLEVLKKAGEEVTPGDKSDYYIKVMDVGGGGGGGGATEVTLLSVLAAVDNLEAYVDGIEALIASTNVLLTIIQTNVDQLEGYLDGVETLITAGNASLASIDTDIDVALSTRASEATLATRASESTLGDVRDLLANDFISGQIEYVQNKTYTLDLYSIDQKTIETLTIKTTSGTCTAAIQINGVSVTNISAVSVSSVETTATASGLNTVAVGDTITLVISSNSSSLDLVFTLKYVRT